MKLHKLFYVILFMTLISSSGYSKTLQFGVGWMQSSHNEQLSNYSTIESRLFIKFQKHFAIRSIYSQSVDKFNNWATGPYPTDFITLEGLRFPKGNIDMHWFEISPIYYLIQDRVKNNIDIYCGTGIGLYYLKYSWDWKTYTNMQPINNEYGIKYNKNSNCQDLGYHLLIGVNKFLFSSVSLNLEWKFLIYKTQLDYNIETIESINYDSEERELDLDSFNFSVSLMINI